MAKLNQIIAIEKGLKSQTYSLLSDANKVAQKSDLFNGFTKAYEKHNEDTEDLPPEAKKVTAIAEKIFSQVGDALCEYIQVVARKDYTNSDAVADIEVDGKALVQKVPVTHLLFLEKQFTDIRTFVSNLPVLDEADEWSEDTNSGLFRSEPVRVHRTKKIAKPIVLYDATDQHPAQTQLISEDVLAGYWKTTKLSGALSKPRKDVILKRIDSLLVAIKEAREEANSIQESQAPTVGRVLFDYIVK